MTPVIQLCSPLQKLLGLLRIPDPGCKSMASVEAEPDSFRIAAELTDLDQFLQRHTFTAVISGLILNQQLSLAVPAAKRVIYTLYNILIAL
ncbi:hypothetical protein D3C73_1184640 [compost metagenome]